MPGIESLKHNPAFESEHTSLLPPTVCFFSCCWDLFYQLKSKHSQSVLVFCLLVCFKTAFLCVALGVLVLSRQTRQTSNLETCLLLPPEAGIKGVCHYTQIRLFIFICLFLNISQGFKLLLWVLTTYRRSQRGRKPASTSEATCCYKEQFWFSQNPAFVFGSILL